ncbi:SNF2 family N-terminal domain-containing protein [Aspergillus bertholletiae]|uniref:SNF2 family N-terminal domain-containing protein n=1 Tax=Aspergillus bertholletiae TaxID=1226010 RepID=A0A5N7AQM2_9EURO|nr:SNF2 family N-terminal domain-containing protein [Aspergillus bertholletiae]
METTQTAIKDSTGEHASPAPPLRPDTPVWPSIGSSGADYDSFHPQPALLPLAPASSRPRKRHAHEANPPTATMVLPKRRRIEIEHLSPQPGDDVFACSPVDPRLALSPAPLYDIGPDVGSVVGEPGAEVPESAFHDQIMSQETMTIIDPVELTLLPQPRHLHRPALEAPVVPTDGPAEVTGLERSLLPQPSTDPAGTVPRADDAEPIVASGVATTDPCGMAARALAVPLMEHQRQGLLWMRAMEASGQKGGILADDMGLGKTVQALSLIVSHPPRSIERHATLIIAPAGLIQQWKHEIGQLLRPGQQQRSVYVHQGAGRGMNFSALNRYNIVLTTFGTITAELRHRDKDRQLRTRNSTLSSRNLPILGPTSRWHRVILDEAQYIKNDRSKVAMASCAIDATYRWCLSGTPVMNHLRELYSLLKFLRVQPYSNLDSFTTTIQRPLQSSWGPLRARGAAQLRSLMNTVMLRRTKASTIQGRPICLLPSKTTENVYVSFNEQERQLYAALESHTRLQFNRHLNGSIPSRNVSRMMGLLLRLRQACCHPFLLSDFAPAMLDPPESREHREANATRFAAAVIARLRDNESIHECPICYEEGVGNPVIFHPCGHSVCMECFTRIPRLATSTHRDTSGDGPMLCPSCRVAIDPSKATDYVSFAKTHSLISPNPSDSHNLLRMLKSLLDRVEVSCEEDNEGGDSVGDDSGGSGSGSSSSSSSSLTGIWAAGGNGDTGLSLEFRTAPEPSSRSSDLSWALLRKQALTNPAAQRRYQRILEGKWISSTKIAKALEIVRGIQARGERSGEREKVVIFSQFTAMLDLVEVPLARNGWGYRRFDGAMKPADRHSATVEFATDPNCVVLLVSLKAGNSGLNLTAASQVIMLDPFWNPYVEEQAVGRVHRIGQRRPVHVHRILVPDTVEDRILDLQDKKRQLIERVLDDRVDVQPVRLGNTDFAYLFVSSRFLTPISLADNFN